MYVTNSLDNTVSSYSISLPTGTPSTIVGSGSTAGNTTDTDPVSVTIEPSLGRYVYTANRLGNSLSGFKLNPDTGALTPTWPHPIPPARTHGGHRGSAWQPCYAVRDSVGIGVRFQGSGFIERMKSPAARLGFFIPPSDSG